MEEKEGVGGKDFLDKLCVLKLRQDTKGLVILETAVNVMSDTPY